LVSLVKRTGAKAMKIHIFVIMIITTSVIMTA